MAQTTKLNWFIKLADHFSALLLPRQDCLSRNSVENDLDSYTFKLTSPQRFLLQDAIGRLEDFGLDSSEAHSCLSAILELDVDDDHLAVEVFPAIYSVGLKLSRF